MRRPYMHTAQQEAYVMRRIVLCGVLVSIGFIMVACSFMAGRKIGQYHGIRAGICNHALVTASHVAQSLSVLREAPHTESVEQLQEIFNSQLRELGATGGSALRHMKLDDDAIERIRRYLSAFPEGYPDSYFAHHALECLGIVTYPSAQPSVEKTQD